MADVKDGDIVFEYPDDIEVSGNKLPDVKEVTVETQAEDIDLEITDDDIPAADRGKEPLPKEKVEELENDTLEDYSERVKQRMAQLKKVWHDERRAKESADRERQEAIKYAQQVADENKKLKSSLSSGEEEYVKVVGNALEQQLTVAKRDYHEAYDLGDSEKIIEAQTKMNDAQMRLSQLQQYRPQFKNAGQEPENPVYIQQNEQASFKPDSKATAWQEKNDWFGKDEEMTSLALGLHEKLVRSGISPASDEYYRRIDSTMQKRFPENFGDATLDEDQPAERTKPSNVVAPATRSTAPKKVRLTKTQVALAKKFGITPEQYARETLKLENANG